jgi:hypothetical protein
MRLQFSKRDRAQHDSRPVARTMTPLGHNRVDDMRQGLKRELKKRDDHEKDCESSDDEEDDDDEKDSTKTPSPSAKPTKSKCSSPSPPPTGLSMQPPSTQLGGLTTTFAGRLQPTVLPLSVSAFPVMSTGASLIATATTLSLNAPAFTPLLPSGTRKSDSGLQAVQASSHPSLSPHAKTALIAFGAISKAIPISIRGT